MYNPPQWDLLADRVWWAYNCLDRDEYGRLPSYRSLEERAVLSNGVLKRAIDDDLKRPGPENLIKLAEALKCDFGWLGTGKGAGPQPPRLYPIPPRPQKLKRAAALRKLGLGPAAPESIDSALQSGDTGAVGTEGGEP